jgi:glucose/arabinose dehydrogenase
MKKLSVIVLCCLAIVAASVSTLTTVTAQGVPNAVTAFQLQPVVPSGLSSPVFVTSARDGSNRLFIVEQGGIIKVLQPGASSATEFLNITTTVLSGGERGLLGLAFHPQYKINRRFFVYYTRPPDGALVIAEYHASAANPNVADTTGTVVLGPIPHPGEDNHNGGMIAFGPDGFLYAAPGDGGGSNDAPNNAQNIEVLLGKVLRIDVDHPNGLVPYSSPPSNPFVGVAGADEIYAYGLRNPFRFSFDRLTGQLYLGDVGQGMWEEIDIITSGGNYGWRVMEGNHCNPAFNGGVCTPPPGHIAPIAEYDQTIGSRCAITGGYVYRGPIATLPAGTYVYADFCSGEIFSLAGGVQTLLLDTARNISAFGEDEAGELYVVGIGGTVERIIDPAAPCAFFLSAASQSFPAAVGAGTVAVTTPSVCNWTAVSNDSWINVTSGSMGTGVGAVQFSLEANSTGATRSGTITIAGQTFTVVQGLAFTDVPEGAPFYKEIGKLAARGITVGCTGTTYCPDEVVTREQMAAFIIRALGEFNPPTPGSQRFLDVPPENPFYNFIDRLAVLNITLGCDSNNYCPTEAVTREQMAAFLMRAKGEFNPPVPPTQRFNDVAPSSPFYNFIDRLQVLSITLGCSQNPPLYCPLGMVTRAEMAAFLVRTFNL